MFSEDFLPPGPILFSTYPVDLVCERFCPDWRSYLPSFLGDPRTGLLRYKCLEGVRAYYGNSKYLSFTEYRTQYNAIHDDDNIIHVFASFLRADNTKLYDSFYPLSLFVILPVLVSALRFLKHRVCLPIFSSIGKRIGRATHGAEWELKNEERIFKFGEYVFRLCFHSTLSLYGFYYLYYLHPEWWSDTSLLFSEGLVYQDIENPMIWYYFIQTAYNVEALIHIFELSFILRNPLKHGFGWGKCIDWAPTIRGDFQEMFIHHLATNALVMLSSSFQLTRAGAVILFLHDISDVPVDLSKLANFVKWKKTTIVCFITMMLVWFVARLIMLPYFPGYSIVYQCPQVLDEPYNIQPHLLYSVYWIFCSLCAMLFLLHLSWFGMFIKMGYLLVNKGEAHDLSEHKKGEKDAANFNKTTNESDQRAMSNGIKKQENGFAVSEKLKKDH